MQDRSGDALKAWAGLAEGAQTHLVGKGCRASKCGSGKSSGSGGGGPHEAPWEASGYGPLGEGSLGARRLLGAGRLLQPSCA